MVINAPYNPHQGQPVLFSGEPLEHACAAILMVHGRGARAGFHYVADLVIEHVLGLRQVWVLGRPAMPEAIVAEARRAFLGDRDKVWLTAALSAL